MSGKVERGVCLGGSCVEECVGGEVDDVVILVYVSFV